MSGSLTIVGLGPARPEHVTAEALEVLRRPAHPRRRAYGLAHVREVVATVAPDLEVRPLDYLYALPGVPRIAAYTDLARMMVRRAFDDGFDVLYLVAGSPLFINDAVLAIRRLCAEGGHPVRLVHGISFLDLILDRVYWTGHQGIQMLSAWNVARDGMSPNPSVPLVLAQLGEFSAGGEALDMSRSQSMLEEVREVLFRTYPPDHPVTVLYSSGPPDYRSEARRIPLRALPDEPVPVYSNLWVPALDGPDLERDVAPPSDGREDG